MQTNKKSAIRYKPLFLLGASLGKDLVGYRTAETLSLNEHFIGNSFSYYYGLNEKLTIGTIPNLDVWGFANYDLKYRFYKNDSLTLSTEFFHLQQYSNGDLTSKAKMSGAKGLISVSGNASFYSSNIIATHWSLVLYNVYQKSAFIPKEERPRKLNNTIQNTTEFILPNWDRVLLGPEYNIDKEAIGFRISFFKLWNIFSYNIGYQTEDITGNIHNLNLDLNWRW